MKHRFFVIPAVDPNPAEEELNRFCSQHRVVALEKHFVADGANSFWSVCVSVASREPFTATSKRKPQVDYKELLSADEFTVYAQLRELRKSIADSEGVPVYALFTNEQLANMVQNRICTQAGLLELEGVGKARVEKYAAPFLKILSAAWSRSRNDEAHKN